MSPEMRPKSSRAFEKRVPGLDHTILKNFRPISNLQFVSKLTEKAVAKQITEHMSTHGLFPSLQSAYRKYHSTETALLKLKNDLLPNMNNGHVTILVLLDRSAAFDTVDHDLLLQKLQSVIGIQGTALLVSIVFRKKITTNLNQRNSFTTIPIFSAEFRRDRA